MKKILLLIILSALSVKVSAQTAEIEFMPDTVIQNNKNVINISVNIKGVTNLFASSITVEYDNRVINVIKFSKGSFLEQNSGANTVQYEVYPDFPALADSFTVDASILGTSSVSGNGTLFRLSFQPVAGGQTFLKIRDIKLRDNNNNPIPVSTGTSFIRIDVAGVKVKCFLEGAFNGSNMSANLLDYLPFVQPYSAAPWNYSGTESVSNNFFNNHWDIVDWVLLELRSTTAAGSLVSRRAALLKRDGSIVDMDGSSPVNFFVPAANYYVIVRHRNHIPVMSAVTVALTSSPVLYDFTTGQGQAYGTNSMIALTGGIFGIIAGEDSHDGFIDIRDFIGIDNSMFQSGYSNHDTNMDGFIDIRDFIKVDNNMFLGSNVPN
ncbi:MAG: cohesin domain-containing protein [Bacteroidota bacterium]|nr:cohesin domain-containing protein [Bacteroidota bacterium]